MQNRVQDLIKNICKDLKNSGLEYEQGGVVQGLSIDIFVPKLRLLIQITEKEHDHGEAYYAEWQEIKNLEEAGFEVIAIPKPDPEPGIRQLHFFLKQKGLL